MAHIFALVCEICLAWIGHKVAYADPASLTKRGAENPALQRFGPDFFVAVPKVLDGFKKSVEGSFTNGSWFSKLIFQAAYPARSFALRTGRDTPLFNKIFFHKIQKDLLGGQCKACICGGSPLAPDVQDFCRIVFGFDLIQGWAMTETTCNGTIQPWGDHRPNNVGYPLQTTSIKVESVKSHITDSSGKPYFSNDCDHLGTPCLGRGEICIKGPTVATSYYKQPKESKGAFVNGGWLRTGDIGIILPDYSIRIVDRVKNLVKLKGGEYIALEALEKESSTSAYVNQSAGGYMISHKI